MKSDQSSLLLSKSNQKKSFWIRWNTQTSIWNPSPLRKTISYILLGLWTLVCIFPVYWSFITTFKTFSHFSGGPYYIPFVDFEPSLFAWRIILEEGFDSTSQAFLNSIIISFTSSTIAVFLGSMAGYALARITYKPRVGSVLLFVFVTIAVSVIIGVYSVSWQIAIASGLAIFLLLLLSIGRYFTKTLSNHDIAFWIISTRVLPPVTVVLPMYVLFQQMGLLKTHWSMIIAYTTGAVPVAVWLMREFFSKIPVVLEESAIIDGATRYRIWWSILLPIVKPGLAATYVLTIIATWNEYLFALFLSTANTQTMPILVASQLTVQGTQWWTMSVVILIMVLPVVAVAIYLQRFVISGLLSGSVKG